MKFQKGQEIRFKHPSVLAGVQLILTGTVIGHGKEVRQKWPIECAECPADTLLVRRQDVFGNVLFHAVHPSEIVQSEVVILKKEA